MKEFFQGWRRKAGVVTLVMALALMAAWIRSGAAGDAIHVSTPSRYNMFFSVAGRFYWWSLVNEAGISRVLWTEVPADELTIILDDDRPSFQGQEALHFRERSLSYSALTIPLTLLSTYLLLWKRRKKESAVMSTSSIGPASADEMVATLQQGRSE